MRRLILLVFAFAVIAAACSTSTSAGFTDSSGDEIVGYEFATGDFTYELSGKASGSFELGDSLKNALPGAVQSALDLLGSSISVEMGYTAEATGTVSSTDNGTTLELTYESLTGSTSIAGQKSDVTLDDLDATTAKYEIGSDGTIQVAEDPLGDKFWLAGSGVAACPSLPPGGADSGQTWDSDVDLGGVFGFVVSPIKLMNTYTASDESGTVEAKTTDIDDLEIKTADIISRVNDSLNLSIPSFDVDAEVDASGEIADSCKLSIPAQELQGMDQKFEIDGTLDVSGTSLPSGLEPGTFMNLELDSTASLKEK